MLKFSPGIDFDDLPKIVKNWSRWLSMTLQQPTFPLRLLCSWQRSEAQIKTEYSHQYWLLGFSLVCKSTRRKASEISKTAPNFQLRSGLLTFHILARLRRLLRTTKEEIRMWTKTIHVWNSEFSLSGVTSAQKWPVSVNMWLYGSRWGALTMPASADLTLKWIIFCFWARRSESFLLRSIRFCCLNLSPENRFWGLPKKWQKFVTRTSPLHPNFQLWLP